MLRFHREILPPFCEHSNNNERTHTYKHTAREKQNEVTPWLRMGHFMFWQLFFISLIYKTTQRGSDELLLVKVSEKHLGFSMAAPGGWSCTYVTLWGHGEYSSFTNPPSSVVELVDDRVVKQGGSVYLVLHWWLP